MIPRDTCPMTSTAVKSTVGLAGQRWLPPMLLLLFVGSGCAALVYEVVWFQLLQLVIGSTSVSMGVLLGTFMGGMCAGSLLLPRVVSSRRHPLRVYAVLEAGIGVLGIAVLTGMPLVERLYVQFSSQISPGLLRGIVASLCLLPPTLLMGATLPAIARWVKTSPEGVSWLGFFYSGNIAGAVFGCLLAGFYLLRVHDMATATYVAVGINASVALLAWVLSAGSVGLEVADEPTADGTATPPADAWSVYLTIALSGMSALGAEVVWTRLLSLLLGGTVYTFSLILSVFLIGLGIGSSVGAVIGRGAGSARTALGLCQWLLTAAVGWTAVMIATSLPYWPISPGIATSPWFTFQVDMVRCLWAVLPPACLWGASFPLALAALASRGQDPGRLVGGVYAANTIGGIVGALVFSLVVVPKMGTTAGEQVLIGIAAAAALVVLIPMVRLAPAAMRLGGVAMLVAATATAGWLVLSVPRVPWQVTAFGRETATLSLTSAPGVVREVPSDPGDDDVFCTYVGEGANVSVAVTESISGTRSFHGAGKIQASTESADMRLQRTLGHLPALLHKKPESVLVVACGAGVTAGSFLLHPDVKRIVICDIEPLVPTVVTPMFGEQNYHVVDGIALENPHTVNGKQVEVVYDDGRHFLRTTREKFDIITSDPIDPWVKGCAALNTVEYYQMCREHLNPGGSVSLWIPLYEGNLDTIKSVVATFFQVFPNGIIWSNDRDGYGYDAVLYGQVEPTVINLDEFQERLDRADHDLVRESLRDVDYGGGFDRVVELGIDLLSIYAGQATQLTEWSRGAQINTDRNLRLQYLAGMWLNANLRVENLASIRKHYRFPEETFVGSAERVKILKRMQERSTQQRGFSHR